MWPEISIVALFVVWLVVKDIQIKQERDSWVSERRELMNRIQHPEVVPLPTEQREIEPREMDEINLVGAVIEE
jgi:hypothetical protein